MAIKKQSRKFTPGKLIKTNGKFSWKKGVIIIIGLAIVGTVLLRFSFAGSPITCYYNSCGTQHGYGHFDSTVWPAAWGQRGTAPAPANAYFWKTYFPGGTSTAPSGVVARWCTQLYLKTAYPNRDQLTITGGIMYNGVVSSRKDYDGLTLNQLKLVMSGKVAGSYIEAQGSDWVKGVICADVGGSGNTKWTSSFVGIETSLWDNALDPYLVVNYAQMQAI